MNRTLSKWLMAAAIMSTGSLFSLSRNIAGGDIDLNISSGWRNDTLSLSIAGIDNIPNPAETRNWNGVQSWASFAKLDVEWCRIHLRGFGNYGDVYEGKSRSLLYQGAENILFSDITSKADKGEVFDYGFSVGYSLPYCVCDQQFVFTPLVGWERSQQNLREFKGHQHIDPAGRLLKQSNNYQTRWSGPTLGYAFRYDLPCNFVFLHAFNWQWAKYRATGHIHEISPDGDTTVVSDSKDKDNGSGYFLSAGLDYQISRRWTLGVGAYYKSMRVRNGTHKEYTEWTTVGDPTEIVDVKTRLNKAYWHAVALMARLEFDF